MKLYVYNSSLCSKLQIKLFWQEIRHIAGAAPICIPAQIVIYKQL